MKKIFIILFSLNVFTFASAAPITGAEYDREIEEVVSKSFAIPTDNGTADKRNIVINVRLLSLRRADTKLPYNIIVDITNPLANPTTADSTPGLLFLVGQSMAPIRYLKVEVNEKILIKTLIKFPAIRNKWDVDNKFRTLSLSFKNGVILKEGELEDSPVDLDLFKPLFHLQGPK